jgi:hypothetical protein
MMRGPEDETPEEQTDEVTGVADTAEVVDDVALTIEDEEVSKDAQAVD